MTTRKTVLAMLLAGIAPMAMAGEVGIGHDHDDPHVAPTNPPETESSSDSYWQELVEWFELDGDEE